MDRWSLPLIAIASWMIAACSSSPARPITIHGSVERGPFLEGGAVLVTELDAYLEPTGRSFATTITDDLGSFSLQIDDPRSSDSAIYLVEVEGYYYDEAVDQVSDAPLRLRALYRPDQGEPATVRVNLFTHLASIRVFSLVLGRVEFESAVYQAETELFAFLALVRRSDEPGVRGTQMSLDSPDPRSSAYLLLLASVLGQIATTEGGGDPSAELEELADELADDFGDDGVLESGTSVAVAHALRDVDVTGIAEAVEARLSSLGVMVDLPDLTEYIDRDRDGIPDAEDNCDTVGNVSQADWDQDGVGNACELD
jgi:starch-binding outer membrane protein, SusD/RagB family